MYVEYLERKEHMKKMISHKAATLALDSIATFLYAERAKRYDELLATLNAHEKGYSFINAVEHGFFMYEKCVENCKKVSALQVELFVFEDDYKAQKESINVAVDWVTAINESYTAL